MSDSAETYDVIVIGAGPAGYITAIRCAQLGLNTACIDDWTGKDGQHCLGGTYMSAGSIASLALMQSADLYKILQQDIVRHGITVAGVELDVPAMVQRKDEIIHRLSTQIAELFNANHIHCIYGHGQLLDGKRVAVTPTGDPDQARIISGENIILAAGSSPFDIIAATLDGDMIVESHAAMNFESVPKKLGIIGAGVIGLEHANLWARLGATVTLFEAQETFLSFVDDQIAQEARRQFNSQGLDIRLGARVTAAKRTPKHVSICYEDKEGEHRQVLDKLIVAVGRRPNTEQLFAPEVDLLLDERGFVHIDEQCMTNLPGVYAIGDLAPGPMLAHKGSEQGIYVAELIAGKESTLNYDTIPSVIYTDPEIAWVGVTEQALRATGEEINIGVVPFSANNCAQAIEQTEGMVKIIANRHTDQLLGIHIIGHKASELIAEAVLAMEFSASTEDIARTVHAFPTLSKSIHEAALAVDKRALHLPPSEDRGQKAANRE